MARFTRGAWAAACVAGLSSLFMMAPGACATAQSAQSDASFKAAIGNVSGSASFVLITVVDAASAARKTGCVLVPFLLSAIEAENRLEPGDGSDARARALALGAAGQVFHFGAAEALKSVNFARLETINTKACTLLRSGHSAYLSEQTDSVMEGSPGK